MYLLTCCFPSDPTMLSSTRAETFSSTMKTMSLSECLAYILINKNILVK